MKQILIECGKNWFEFTKSETTGQLDFKGKLADSIPDVAGWQKIASSTYFSPAYYTYLCDEINMTPYVYVAQGVDISDRDVYDFLIHVGSLLAAVDSKNSLLAGELYLRKQTVFDKFAPLTQYILKDLSVEILFSLCYGRMKQTTPEEILIIYNNVIDKIDYNPASSSFDQALMGYIRNNEITLTLPLVGTGFYSWNPCPDCLEHLCDNLDVANLVSHIEKIRKAKHDFYSTLEVVSQAEPYNFHDANSILVSIEDTDAKIYGNPGLVSAGHIRATAAAMIRTAKPKKMAYKTELVMISGEKIIVRISI